MRDNKYQNQFKNTFCTYFSFQRTLLGSIILILFAIAIVYTIFIRQTRAAVTLTLDLTQKFQKWEGWEVTIPRWIDDIDTLGGSQPVQKPMINKLLANAVKKLGITALRMGINLSGKFGVEINNDNDDPFNFDDTRIDWHGFDPYMKDFVMPMKALVEARGEKFTLNFQIITFDFPKGTMQWHLSQPEEYAELVVGCIKRMDKLFKVIPDYITPSNEPDNHTSMTKTQLLDNMQTLMSRLQQEGYTNIKLRYPDTMRINSALSFLDKLEADYPDVLPYLKTFSFHGYGGLGMETLNSIRDRAQGLGITTAQTEWMNSKNISQDIYKCIVWGNVSLYQHYVLAWQSQNGGNPGVHYILTGFNGDNSKPPSFDGFHVNTDFTYPRSHYYAYQQYSRYIRPGDIRVDISSTNANIKPVAFEDTNGRLTIVVLNEKTGNTDVIIKNVKAGKYNITLTDAKNNGTKVGKQVVRSQGDSLTFSFVRPGTVTFCKRKRNKQ